MKKQRYLVIFILIIISLVFSSCGNKNNQKAQIVLTIDEQKISLAEVTIYLLRVKEEFEKVAGTVVWDIEDFSGGKTAEQVAKEGALENLIRDKILYKRADSLKISFDESEINEISKKAEEFYNQIPQEVIEANDITNQTVVDTFKSFSLASEVSDIVTNSYEPSEEQILEKMLFNEEYIKLKNSTTEDILTLYVLKRILIASDATDKEQKEAYDRAIKIYEKAKVEDFDKLINEYTEEEFNQEGYKVSAALMEDSIKQSLQKISIGDISLIKIEQGYGIFKLIDIEKPEKEDISDYEKEFNIWEEKLKDDATIQLQQEAFSEIYNEWKNEAVININNEVWEKISIFNN